MTEDNPDWQIYMRMLRAMYHANTAREAIAGTVESIRAITSDTLYQCHKAFYTPSNMILTVVGDVDPKEVEAAAVRILPMQGGPVIERDYGAEPEGIVEKETRMEMEVAAPQFLAGFKCRPGRDGEDGFRQSLIGELASDLLLGDSSPLYLRLYDQGLINDTFGGDYESMPGAAFFYAGGDSRDAGAVRSAILEEAANIAEHGVDADYFLRVQRAIYGSFLRGFNSFENIAVSLTEGYFKGYDPFLFPEVFGGLTQEDVRAFLRENVTEERCVLSEIVPKE